MDRTRTGLPITLEERPSVPEMTGQKLDQLIGQPGYAIFASYSVSYEGSAMLEIQVIDPHRYAFQKAKSGTVLKVADQPVLPGPPAQQPSNLVATIGQAAARLTETEQTEDEASPGYRCPRCGIGRLIFVAFIPAPGALIRGQPRPRVLEPMG